MPTIYLKLSDFARSVEVFNISKIILVLEVKEEWIFSYNLNRRPQRKLIHSMQLILEIFNVKD